jgi:hypothetical protein
MTRIGVTGHQKLPEAAKSYARKKIRSLLEKADAPLTGLSSLAAGADQIFAREILDHSGRLWVVIPSKSYQSTLTGEDLAAYRELLSRASDVTRLDFSQPGEAAYNAAGRWIVENCDELVAIWDGQPARGLGGTGDVVAYARELGRKVRVYWPKGVVRPLMRMDTTRSRTDASDLRFMLASLAYTSISMSPQRDERRPHI